jgi:hypothetical protein
VRPTPERQTRPVVRTRPGCSSMYEPPATTSSFPRSQSWAFGPPEDDENIRVAASGPKALGMADGWIGYFPRRREARRRAHGDCARYGHARAARTSPGPCLRSAASGHNPKRLPMEQDVMALPCRVTESKQGRQLRRYPLSEATSGRKTTRTGDVPAQNDRKPAPAISSAPDGAGGFGRRAGRTRRGRPQRP